MVYLVFMPNSMNRTSPVFLRWPYFFVAFSFLFLGGLFMFQDKLAPATIPLLEKKVPRNFPKETGADRAAAQNWRMIHDPATGQIPMERLIQAKEYKDEVVASWRHNPLSPVPNVQWEERGPNNVAGRSRVVWFDLNDAANGYRKVWAAGVSGGLWVTNNIQETNPVWNKVNDFFDNIAVNAFVQNPNNPNEMYFGTGEGWFNLDAVSGLGIWKSTNGGVTWNRLMSTANFVYVQDMVIDSRNNLYVAVRPRLNTDASGIQKSSDGGNTWVQVTGTPVQGPSARGSDLEIAANGDLYASMGHQSIGRILRSDAGKHGENTGNAGTWDDITPDPVSNAIMTNTNEDKYDRIELAVAPNDSKTLYALFEGNGTSNCDYIKQYNAASNTWTGRNVPTIIDQGSNTNFARGQAWYDLIALVDPNNAARLFIGGIDGLRSDNNGASFTQVTTWSLSAATGYTANQRVHADHHMYQYAPGSSKRMILGTDGGIYYTDNADATGSGVYPNFTAKNNGFNITQCYSVAMHPTNPNYFLIGTQDNGTQRFTQAGLNNTTQALGGDGGYAFIDRDEPNIQLATYNNNNYVVSINSGESFQGRDKNDEGEFINPMDYDDVANIIYAAASPGNYFRYKNPERDGISETVAVNGLGRQAISHVQASAVVANRIYIGTFGGRVVRVDNANRGTSQAGEMIFNQINGAISCVAVDPSNEDHLLVTSSSFGVNSVWETKDGGASWQSVEGDLPDMPVRWALFDPRNRDWAIIATELGVWSTDNLDGANTRWSPTNSGLANVRVDQVRYMPTTRVLTAATHGRGLYTAVLNAIDLGPAINFERGKVAVREGSGSGSGCKTYSEYTVPMTITKAPNADALVELTVEGGTAQAGVDFDFTTNGNFANPSRNIVFRRGSTQSATVTIRIYDDGEVEDLEDFRIGYTLTGTGNAIRGMESQTLSVEIVDNDAPPTLPTSVSNELGTTDVGFSVPFAAQATDAKTQMLYTAQELKDIGIHRGTITRIGFDITTKNTTGSYENLTLKMGHTKLTTLRNQGFQSGLTTVYTVASYKTVDGANDFVLQTPFDWNGTDNILVEICFDNGSTNPAGGTASVNDFTAVTNTGTVTGTTNPVLAIWATAINTSCANIGSAATIGQELQDIGRRPVLRFSANVAGTIIATTPGTRSVNFGPNAEIYAYDANGNLMMHLKNPGEFDFGCTQINIDRAGSGAKAFMNNVAGNYVADKVFSVIPEHHSASAAFDITLYYTRTEVEGWQSATGQSWNAAAIAKTAGKVTDYPPGEVPAASTEISTAVTRGRLGDHYTISSRFNTGFSGFAVGVFSASVSPFGWVNVSATLQGTNVLLQWSTTGERTGTKYEVEWSRDSLSGYARAATVDGTATSLQSTNQYSYTFTGATTPGSYFFRIRMVETDGTSRYTNVMRVELGGGAITADPYIFWSVQGSLLSLSTGNFGSHPFEYAIVDAQGRILARGGPFPNLPLVSIQTMFLPKGVYFLVLNNGSERKSLKFIK